MSNPILVAITACVISGPIQVSGKCVWPELWVHAPGGEVQLGMYTTGGLTLSVIVNAEDTLWIDPMAAASCWMITHVQGPSASGDYWTGEEIGLTQPGEYEILLDCTGEPMVNTTVVITILPDEMNGVGESIGSTGPYLASSTVEDNLVVKTAGERIISMEIMDMSGTLAITEQPGAPGFAQLSVSGLAPGIYLVRVHLEAMVVTKRFLKR